MSASHQKMWRFQFVANDGRYITNAILLKLTTISLPQPFVAKAIRSRVPMSLEEADAIRYAARRSGRTLSGYVPALLTESPQDRGPVTTWFPLSLLARNIPSPKGAHAKFPDACYSACTTRLSRGGTGLFLRAEEVVVSRVRLELRLAHRAGSGGSRSSFGVQSLDESDFGKESTARGPLLISD
jgi:hypothetical protein